MSLILDALRKSEAERQRGKAPGLFTPMAPLPTRRRRSPNAAWLIAAALLGSIGLAYWLQRERPIPAAPIASTGHDIAAAEPPMPAAAAVPAATPPASASAATPARVAAIAPTPIVPAPATIAANAAQTIAPPPATPAPADMTATAAVATEPAGSVETEYLPRLSELDTARRGSLPPLKLSMHVWSEQPERRIAIIDGQRVGEGASLAGTVVAEIRRDGVVLELDGRRYLLPRP